MNKFKYITLGILLVGTTLLLNHLLQLDWPLQEDRGSEIVQNDTRNASLIDDQPEDLIDGGQAPSLRDRILGRRETEMGNSANPETPSDQNGASPFQLPNGSPSLAQAPKDRSHNESPAGPTPVDKDTIDEIVVPDFSHLETTILDTDGQSFVAQTDPPRLIKIPDPPELDRNWARDNAETASPANAFADRLQLPPSHNITPRQLAPSRAGSNPPGRNNRTRSFSRKTGIPFGLNQKAHSELAAVHHRSEQVKPATTNFLDHKTEPGDSLQSLSDQYYGRPDFYLDIYLANQDKLVNPSTLPPGMTIKIPIFQD
ncbi:MAG: LysM peptidoglycan-binding domain-containing protein [Mariniblastus sp.]|nr:LysM peptidoglycan-binding domain-containing protein [Mariniblastus sp.]